MTDFVKISALPGAGTLTGSELLPVVQAGASVQTTLAAVLALLGLGASHTWTPTVASNFGSLTTVVVNNAVYYIVGNLVYFEVQIGITTNGTGGGNIQITPPTIPSANGFSASGFGELSGKQIFGSYVGHGSPANLIVTNYDGTYPAADGETLTLSGWYENS